jgi:hypothetical protein
MHGLALGKKEGILYNFFYSHVDMLDNRLRMTAWTSGIRTEI